MDIWYIFDCKFIKIATKYFSAKSIKYTLWFYKLEKLSTDI